MQKYDVVLLVDASLSETNRKEVVSEFEKLIKKNGGVMVSSVSKNTSFLITNETESSSSKFVKAKDLEIPIISENKLLKMIEE